MFVQFLILSFGILITNRILDFQLNRKTLSEAISKEVAKIQIIYLWTLTILSPWISNFILLILLLVPNLAAARLDWILNFILRHQFHQRLLTFIDEIILLMMTGKSFRDSYHLLTHNNAQFFELKMKELFAAGNLQAQGITSKLKEFNLVTDLVQAVEKNPHRALDKLKAFRRHLHWNLSFKKRSQQATIQVKAQATILSLLYLVLLGFVLCNRTKDSTPVILISLTLFLVGLILLFLLSRRRAWKT